ncbi:MAG: type II secretion system protein GspG [Planctomycetes bacterium]|nr:type II secretion system protein GspG [Planctomycetota bacterium]
MKSTFGRLSVFIFIVIGIVAYMKVGAGLFDKVKNSAIRIELNSIDRSLYGYSLTASGYPSNLKRFLVEHFKTKSPKDVGTDPWGREYDYTTDGSGYRIVSAGADGSFGTSDDFSLVRSAGEVSLLKGASAVRKEASASGAEPARSDDPLIRRLEALLDSSRLREGRHLPSEEEMADLIIALLGGQE